jgi:hypothetical protein
MGGALYHHYPKISSFLRNQSKKMVLKSHTLGQGTEAQGKIDKLLPFLHVVEDFQASQHHPSHPPHVNVGNVIQRYLKLEAGSTVL